MKTLEVYHKAVALGLKLEPSGDRLLVFGDRCPPDFAEVLRQHKRELMDWLEARACHQPPDCAPWLHTAKQVLTGEFDGGERSVLRSLIIGLRSIEHPACRRALERLRGDRTTTQ